ncbi:MAG: IgGFc-binding protein [Bacteroidales bacterium]
METSVKLRFTRHLVTFVIAFFLSIFSVYSQVDFEFWFAAPYANENHAPQWPQGNDFTVGGRPIYLRVASQDEAADVTVSIPSNPSFTPITLSIPANSTDFVDLTEYIDDIQSSNVGDVIENKAIHVQSTALITAYYEISSVLNTDIFSLKGKNALGTEFYAPMQNIWDNDPTHNSELDGAPADPAYSYIVIAATENNTEVQITPTSDAVGITAGQTKTVFLNKGQTYVVRAENQTASAGKLGGTYITSNKEIAVTVADDSVYPQEYTSSGDCEDYAGDQIVPTDIIGTEYIVIKGQGYEDDGNQGVDFQERVFVTATEDTTEIYVDGTLMTTLDAGEQTSYQLGSEATSSYTYVSSSKPVYAYHHSGYQCEMAAALLPAVGGCTGSYNMGFVRTYGEQDNEEFYMNLMVKGGGEGDFLLNGESSTPIENATFQTIDGTDWRVARIYYSPTEMPVGAYYLQNTTSLFHMAMMNSTAHDWGDGQGYRLMGAYYGYFSKFSDNLPIAYVKNNDSTYYFAEAGEEVRLIAEGGFEYEWTGYEWTGDEWVEMTPPYYLSNTSVENPFVVINTIGKYKYTASINTECYGLEERSVVIEVGEPLFLNDIHDTVCSTPPYENISEHYNLFNLNDTIIKEVDREKGYFVDSWYKWIEDSTHVWDDFEEQRSLVGEAYNGSMTVTTNPDQTGVNVSESVGHLQKECTSCDNPSGLDPGYSWDDYNQSVWYDIELNDVMNLSHGTEFSFDIMYDGSSLSSYGEHAIYLELFNDAGYTVKELGGTLSSDDLQNPEWQQMTFDLSGYDLKNINSARIRIFVNDYYADNIANDLPVGYYIDNIKREVIKHEKRIADPYNYRITDGDTVRAKVLNENQPARVDTAHVYFAVEPSRRPANDLFVSDICADVGNEYYGFDLTEYKYKIGGALVADKDWYLDEGLINPVSDPTNATVSGTQTFWAFIDDECEHIGSLTIEISPLPEIITDSAVVEICEVVSIGGDRGIIDLTDAREYITSDADATVMWFTDEEYTTPVTDAEQVFAADGDVFYAEMYIDPDCRTYAKLAVNVIPLDDIVFDDFTVCEDGGDVVLSASPSGGVYSADSVVTGNIFDPREVGAGDFPITYTIENQGCTNFETITATVHPEVFVSIDKDPVGKVHVGSTVDLDATIIPAPESDYSFTWSNADSLVDPTVLNPTTKELSEPTTFRLDVTNDITGCTGSMDVLVDVYVPVNVDLDFSANPVCAGDTVILEAKKSGGFGPYQYDWTIPSGVDYTFINDSVISLNNPQTTSTISVEVTDSGINPADVVYAEEEFVVFPNPSITMSNPAPTCANEIIEINPQVSGGTPAYEHTWSQDTEILETSVTDDYALVNTNDYTGTYYLQYSVVDQNNCSAQENVEVQIFDLPVVSASGPDKVCVSDIVSLEGNVLQGNTADGSHEWYSEDPAWLNDLSSTIIPNPEFSSNSAMLMIPMAVLLITTTAMSI